MRKLLATIPVFCIAGCYIALGGGTSAGAGTSSTTGGAGTGGSSGGGGSSGSPDSGIPPGTTEFSLSVGPLAVSAGTQAVYCAEMHLSNPDPIQVIGFTSTQTLGGHHLILLANKTDQPDAAPVACNQSAAIDPTKGSMIYISQIDQDSQIFPAGVGMTLPAHASVMLQVHYIDATPSDISVSTTVNVLAGAAGSVTTTAAPLLFYNNGLVVPEGTSTATATCDLLPGTIPGNLNFFMLAGHMHSHGTDFVLDFSDLDGGTRQLYETHAWDSPTEEDFTPPLLVQPGTSFTWTCTYFNADAGTIDQPDEMCAVLGNYYPAPNGSMSCFAQAGACYCFNGGTLPGG